MDETSFNNYTPIDISKKDSGDYITIDCEKNKPVSKLNSGGSKSRYKLINVTVACKLAIVAAIIFAGCGNFIYLSASGTREVKYVIPDGYILLPKQYKGHTLFLDYNSTEAPMTKKGESSKASQAKLSVIQTTTSTETMKTSAPDCKTAWLKLGSSCYYFSEDEKSWQDAFDTCVELGSYLAEITSKVVNDELVRKAKVLGGSRWIGMTDIDKEGTWEWASSKTIAAYTSWGPNEPNNLLHNGLDEDCCELRQINNYVWNDAPCQTLIKYICEKKKRLND